MTRIVSAAVLTVTTRPVPGTEAMALPAQRWAELNPAPPIRVGRFPRRSIKAAQVIVGVGLIAAVAIPAALLAAKLLPTRPMQEWKPSPIPIAESDRTPGGAPMADAKMRTLAYAPANADTIVLRQSRRAVARNVSLRRSPHQPPAASATTTVDARTNFGALEQQILIAMSAGDYVTAFHVSMDAARAAAAERSERAERFLTRAAAAISACDAEARSGSKASKDCP